MRSRHAEHERIVKKKISRKYTDDDLQSIIIKAVN